MVLGKPFIHLFKTPGGYYLFDVNTNSILNIDSKTYHRLEDILSGKCDINCIEEYADIAVLRKNGYLLDKKVTEVAHPVNDLLQYYLEKKVEMATLQVTRNCNLRCSYCTYSGKYFNRNHENKSMSFEIAKKGIDFLINHSSDCEQIHLGFYGGEPLLEFDLIKRCIEYAQEKSEGKKITFGATTNGTLLNEEIIDYFVEHDLSLTVSLDGNKEAHDKNRKFAVNGKGSFDIIIKNLEMIKLKYPEYIKNVLISIVMDSENDFGCITDFFSSCDIIEDSLLRSTYVSDNYMKDSYKIEEKFNIMRNYEYFKMYLSKIKRLSENSVSKLVSSEYQMLKGKMHDHWNRTKNLGDKCHPGGPCIAGTQRLFINVNGDMFPCERVSETSDVMKIGNIDDGFDLNKVRDIVNIGQISAENCKKCWAFMHCQLCAASADDLTKFSTTKKTSACANVRRYIEEQFKNYCVLRELGHDFGENSIPILDFLTT